MPNVITLSHESESIKYLSQKDKRLAKVFNMVGDITVPYEDDPFIFLLDTIIGQMLSKKAANFICQRVHDLCLGDITPQAVSNLSVESLRSVGVSNSKAKYVLNLSYAVSNNLLNFDELKTLDDNSVYKKLTSVQGIGSWSAKMYLIFVLNRQNILPFEDGAFLQGYCWLYKTTDKSPDSIRKRCRKWEPYSSIAARYLYKALDTGLTKNEFHLMT